MKAEPGDDLIVDKDGAGQADRVGTILEVGGTDGHPEFLVHWVAGDYDSLVSPWPGVHVRHRAHPGGLASSLPDTGGSRLVAATARG
jgi:Domain of unknown function (DUF1918)